MIDIKIIFNIILILLFTYIWYRQVFLDNPIPNYFWTVFLLLIVTFILYPPLSNYYKSKRKNTKILIISIVIIITLFSIISFFLKKGSRKKIYVGCLYSREGVMGPFEGANYNMLISSFDYIKKRFKLNVDIIPLFKELNSNDSNYPIWIEECVKQYNVKYFFGCWKSSERKEVLDVIRKYNVRLFYPLQYEGVECSSNVYYFGATPNQQIIPALDYYFPKYSQKDVYIIGSDYVYPQIAAEIVKNYVSEKGKELNKEIIKSTFHPLDADDFTEIIDYIYKNSPNGAVIVNNINGSSYYTFTKQFSEKFKKSIDRPFTNKQMDDPTLFMKELRNWGEKEDTKIIPINKNIYDLYPIISFSFPENNIDIKYIKDLYLSSSCWNFVDNILDNEMYIFNPEYDDIKNDMKFLKIFRSTVNNKSPIGDTQYCTFLSTLFFGSTIRDLIKHKKDIDDVNNYDDFKLQSLYTVTGTHNMFRNNHINKQVFCCYINENANYTVEYESYTMIDPDPYIMLINKDINLVCETSNKFLNKNIYLDN